MTRRGAVALLAFVTTILSLGLAAGALSIARAESAGAIQAKPACVAGASATGNGSCVQLIPPACSPSCGTASNAGPVPQEPSGASWMDRAAFIYYLTLCSVTAGAFVFVCARQHMAERQQDRSIL